MTTPTTSADQGAPIHIGAVDLGASSGRVMVGTLEGGRLQLQEMRRFPNAPIPVPTARGMRLYWDVLRLWDEIRQGLLAGMREVGPLSAVGIDSWAVDYGLMDEDDALVGQVTSYRCQRTVGIPDEVFAALGASRMYGINGLQVQAFNTVFQLVAESREGGLGTAGMDRTMLLLPDLLAHWLTGASVAEVTNASTTGLVDARARRWSDDLLGGLRDQMGLDFSRILPRLVEAGEIVGHVLPEVLDLRGPDGIATPVVAVGTHDTASAVAAVPAEGRDFAYVSCGTWSLVGLELDQPVLTEASRQANFTNELGVDGTVRYLKNVMGLWVFNEAVRTWREQGHEVSFRELDSAAEHCEPLRTVVDINDASFFPPGDMAARIDALADAIGQPRPRNLGEYVRCIDDSLALAYRRAVREAAALAGHEVRVLHMVGGGIRNRLLCQLAADASGLPVVAGPEEATAMGNILVAARGVGAVSGSLADLRAIVRASTELRHYEPRTGRVDGRGAASGEGSGAQGLMPMAAGADVGVVDAAGTSANAAAWDEAERRVFGNVLR